MVRLSTSMLESYRLFMAFEFMSLADLHRSLLRTKFQATYAMGVGTAFHAISEGKATVERESYQSDGFYFDKDSTDGVLKNLGPGAPEVKDYSTIIDDRIQVTARVDHLNGYFGHEIKTKVGKQLKPVTYSESWQWKVYCRVFSLKALVYHLVRLDQDKHSGVFHATGDTLTLYPYPGLNEEVDQAFRELADYMQTINP